MTEEQRYALDLADCLDGTIASGADAATVGPTDAELIVRALRAYAATLAAL